MLRYLLALVALVSALPAAAATQFNFTFALKEGRSISLNGMGTFTTSAGVAGANGSMVYTITGATGSIVPTYNAGVDSYAILGVTDFFGMADNRLFVDANGTVSYDSFGIEIDGMTGVLKFDRAAGTADGFEGGYDIASLIFPTATATLGAVPEPATWAFAMLGLGIAGGALRRRPTLRTAVA